MEDPIAQRVDAEIVDAVDGIPAAEHMVPLKQLMQHEPSSNPAQSKPSSKAGRSGNGTTAGEPSRPLLLPCPNLQRRSWRCVVLSAICSVRELPNAAVRGAVALRSRFVGAGFCRHLQRNRQVALWIGMPFCFTTQLQQKAVATELAAQRRLAKSRKPPAKGRSQHGAASVPERSKAAHVQQPQARAPKAASR
jgi:hypothetical protein